MTDKAQEFVNEYLPVAKQVSEKTGISPSILLAQWGLETGYGTKTVGAYNFGNIKDISGHGKEGIDSKTKSKDRYINFESPEAFGDYYAHYISRKFPESLNAGSDINKFSAGLKFGEPQGYAEDENYGKSLLGAFNVTSKYIPEEKTNIFSGITPIANKILESGKPEISDLKLNVPYDATIAGGAIGAASRMKEMRDLFSRLVSSGIDPDSALKQSIKLVSESIPESGGINLTPVSNVRIKDPLASGVENYGEKMAGHKLPDVLKSQIEDMTTGKHPTGKGAGDIAKQYSIAIEKTPRAALYNVSPGFQIALEPEAVSQIEAPKIIEKKPSISSKISNIISAVPSAISRAIPEPVAQRLNAIANWSATTPGWVGKGLGALGGATAGYQGYEAIQALKNAGAPPEKIQAILDMMSAAGSGASALPIPPAQLPGLALGLGIPAAGYVGRKISGALPDFGISEEARKAVR